VILVANVPRDVHVRRGEPSNGAAINGQTTTYVYDGDGRRVQKTSPSGTTVYVYDPFGNLAQEYSATPTDTGTKYLTTDALGSTRLVTNSDGSLEKSYDYLPYGEEIRSTYAGRGSTFPGSPYPHPPSTQDLEFTAKERDSETGLDFFGARYFSSAQGRFTSPDEPLEDQDPEDPQSWNLFGYVRNNPLRFTDADGRTCVNGQDENGTACFDTTVFSPKEIATGAAKSTYNDIAGLLNIFFYYQNAYNNSYTGGKGAALELPYAQMNNAGQQKGANATLLYGLLTNPFGKKGGPLHQAKVAQVEAEVEARGLKAVRELKVDTPSGSKSARYVDVAGVDANGNVVEMHQVGRQTGGGQPVSRERQALDDIQKAPGNPTGQRPTFHPYN
jgi:RHS repeat-associated protein